MRELGTFVIKYPCWILIHKDSVEFDVNGEPFDIKKPITVCVIDDTSGGAMFPLFTTVELAEQFQKTSSDYEGYVAFPLSTRKILVDALWTARGHADAVTFDKPAFRGKPIAIWPIGYAIERVEADLPL